MDFSAHTSPERVDPQFPEDAVEVGRVLGAWGVKGWIKVQPFSLDPQALFSTKRWFLRPAPDAGPELSAAWPAPPLLRITQAREHGDAVVACAQDLEGRAAAQALRGARVFVARSSFPTALQGEYYWVDLIGMTVVNRQGALLGQVVGLLETGAHDVLRIQPTDQNHAGAASGGVGAAGGRGGKTGRSGAGADAASFAERLIPFVSAYVDAVDMTQRQISVDWGLDY